MKPLLYNPFMAALCSASELDRRMLATSSTLASSSPAHMTSTPFSVHLLLVADLPRKTTNWSALSTRCHGPPHSGPDARDPKLTFMWASRARSSISASDRGLTVSGLELLLSLESVESVLCLRDSVESVLCLRDCDWDCCDPFRSRWYSSSLLRILVSPIG